MEARETCSRSFSQSEKLAQPAFIAGPNQRVCLACADVCFPPGVTQLSSSMAPFVCECSGNGHECLFAQAHGSLTDLRAYGAKLLLQSRHDLVGRERIQSTVMAHLEMVKHFDPPDEALNVVPDEILALAFPAHGLRDEDAVLTALLAWFKTFFSWVGQEGLPCDKCQSTNTKLTLSSGPNAEERLWSASYVELFRCGECKAVTRFPRFNNAQKLLLTRRGRCGEFAQAFTFILNSLGFSTRLVLDLTDHVWTEFWSDNRCRWVCVDTGENKADTPLLYEIGWGKKLNYTFSIASNQVVDSTRRYTQDYDAVLQRRDICGEEWLEKWLHDLNLKLGADMDAIGVEKNLLAEGLGRSDPVKPEELEGRKTGSDEWKAARNEL